MKRQDTARLPSAATAMRKHVYATFREAGADLALLALVQILCFLALARLEPRLILLHLYQLIPYAALLLLIAYGKHGWAYMIGSLVSVVWLALAYLAGILDSAAEQLRTVESFCSSRTLVALVAIVTAVVALLMILCCRLRWVESYAGREPKQRIFVASVALVVTYYGILLRWFWDLMLSA